MRAFGYNHKVILLFPITVFTLLFQSFLPNLTLDLRQKAKKQSFFPSSKGNLDRFHNLSRKLMVLKTELTNIKNFYQANVNPSISNSI